MTARSLDKETVQLVPHLLWMEERVDMTLYTITEWNLVHRNTSNLPSVLLMLITFATTFFKPYFFEAALSVNLTTMLVMTTIFISVMQMLPATAYVKMVDVWLIFGQLVPFVEVVLLTAMEYIREGDGSGEDVVSSPKAEKEEVGSERMDAKRRANSQMYWLKVTGGKQKLYHAFNIVLQRRRSFQHLYWSFRWCMSSLPSCSTKDISKKHVQHPR